MIKAFNIRKKLINLHTNGKLPPIYIVKTKKQNTDRMSIQWKHPLTLDRDCYITIHPSLCKEWHKNKDIQLCLLHELGHIGNFYNNFFINEIFATIYGFFKYRNAMFPHLTIKDLIIYTYLTRKYFIQFGYFKKIKKIK